MGFRPRARTVVAACFFGALTCATVVQADDEDRWELLPPTVTSTALAAQHASMVASAGFEKKNGRREITTYWATGKRNYRCVDLQDTDHATVDAYCYGEKQPEAAFQLPRK